MGLFKESLKIEKEFRAFDGFVYEVSRANANSLVNLMNEYGFSYIGEFLERVDCSGMEDYQVLAIMKNYIEIKQRGRKVEIYKWQTELIEKNLLQNKNKGGIIGLYCRVLQGKYNTGEINGIISNLALTEQLMLLNRCFDFEEVDYEALAVQVAAQITEEDVFDLPRWLLYANVMKKHPMMKKIVKSLKTEVYEKTLDVPGAEGEVGFIKVWETYGDQIDNIAKMSGISKLRKAMNIIVMKVELGKLTTGELVASLPTKNQLEYYNAKELEVIRQACINVVNKGTVEMTKAIKEIVYFYNGTKDRYTNNMAISITSDLQVNGIFNVIDLDQSKNREVLYKCVEDARNNKALFEVLVEKYEIPAKKEEFYRFKMGELTAADLAEETVVYILKKQIGSYSTSEYIFQKEMMDRIFKGSDLFAQLMKNGSESRASVREWRLSVIFEYCKRLNEADEYWEMFFGYFNKTVHWKKFLLEKLGKEYQLPTYMEMVMRKFVRKLQLNHPTGDYGYQERNVVKQWGDEELEQKRNSERERQKFLASLETFSQSLSDDYNKINSICKMEREDEHLVAKLKTTIQPEVFYSVHSYGTLALKLNEPSMVEIYKNKVIGMEAE